jgi:diguanylate cyclase (GGDEF)-like protein/excisionase family DNA binding protein
MSVDAFNSEFVRARIADALSSRRPSLISDSSSIIDAGLPVRLDATTRERIAERLLDALAAAVSAGGADPHSRSSADLEELADRALAQRHLFGCAYLSERTVIDDLALDEEIGAISADWPLVAQLVRRASFDALGALAERLLARAEENPALDPLTTLVRQPVFELALSQEIRRAQRHRYALSLILLRLTNLLDLHAEHGEGMGDLVLQRTGIIVRGFFRRDDWVARHGADGVVALLPETRLDAAVELASRLRNMVEGRLVVLDHKTDTRVPVRLAASAVGTGVVESNFSTGFVLGLAHQGTERAAAAGEAVGRIELEPATISLIGAANLLGCRSGAVRRLVRDGQIPAVRREGHYHLDRSAVEQLRIRQPALD